MRIIVSGGNSRFSHQLHKQKTNHNVFFMPKDEMNIMSIDSISAKLNMYEPDIFIHTAALSRPMDIHNTDLYKSITTNIIGTSNCVIACNQFNVKFVYISTDFVYPGINGNYKETDGVFPINKYAWSKLGGECAVMLYDNSLILRMGMIEKPFPHKKAFKDSFKSCIWTEDAAKIVFDLIDKDATGIYNIGGERNSIYHFVWDDKTIEKESRLNISEKVPKDISMDITKLKEKLK